MFEASIYRNKCTSCHLKCKELMHLICDHKICEKCLNDMDDEVKFCPNRILDASDKVVCQTCAKIEVKLGVTCDWCMEEESEFKCEECKEWLCYSCQLQHNMIRSKKDHFIISAQQIAENKICMKEKYKICNFHEGRPMEMYCNECHEVCCLLGLFSLHREHEHETLEEKVKKSYSVMEQKLKDAWISTVKKEKLWLQCDQEVDQNADEILKEIKERSDKFIKHIERETEEKQCNVTDRVKAYRNSSNKTRCETQKSKKDIECLKKKISNQQKLLPAWKIHELENDFELAVNALLTQESQIAEPDWNNFTLSNQIIPEFVSARFFLGVLGNLPKRMNLISSKEGAFSFPNQVPSTATTTKPSLFGQYQFSSNTDRQTKSSNTGLFAFQTVQSKSLFGNEAEPTASQGDLITATTTLTESTQECAVSAVISNAVPSSAREQTFPTQALPGIQLDTQEPSTLKDLSISERSKYDGEEGNDSYQGPCFIPIVPIPDEVDVKTGEEEETELINYRAKLYRFDDNQWKECGLGNIKILVNKETGQPRVVMRREQVHKVCANFLVKPEISISFRQDQDKVLTWTVMDFTEGEGVLEKFSCRFNSPEIARDFKTKFEEAKEMAKKVTTKKPTEGRID